LVEGVVADDPVELVAAVFLFGLLVSLSLALAVLMGLAGAATDEGMDSDLIIAPVFGMLLFGFPCLWVGWKWMGVSFTLFAKPKPKPFFLPVPEPEPAQANPHVTVVIQNSQPTTQAPPQTVVHLRCPHCGTTTPESERQCQQCGATLR
jgi:hypothetical protein